MKQGLRFVVKPGAFFNQLQWSKNHSAILLTFLALALVEGYVGKQHSLYGVFANIAQKQYHIGSDAALWLVTAAKLGLMIAGSLVLSFTIWLVGNVFGGPSSQRVLSRRLAIVFTVFLAGYTANHFAGQHPEFAMVSLGLYFWGMTLGYFALREQFGLNHLQTAALGLFAMIATTTTWQYSNQLLETAARKHQFEVSRTAPVIPKAHRR